MASSADDSELRNYDVDDFVVDYIKYRIECDDNYTWYDAPETTSEFVDEYYAVRKVAQTFETRYTKRFEQEIKRLLAAGPLTYNYFNEVLDEFIDSVGEDGKKLSYSRLIAVLAFSGYYARKLAELDAKKTANDGHDYRSDITHLSIYASKRLEKKIAESWGDGYSWKGFMQMIEKFNKNQDKRITELSAWDPLMVQIGGYFLAAATVIGGFMIYWRSRKE